MNYKGPIRIVTNEGTFELEGKLELGTNPEFDDVKSWRTFDPLTTFVTKRDFVFTIRDVKEYRLIVPKRGIENEVESLPDAPPGYKFTLLKEGSRYCLVLKPVDPFDNKLTAYETIHTTTDEEILEKAAVLIERLRRWRASDTRLDRLDRGAEIDLTRLEEE